MIDRNRYRRNRAAVLTSSKLEPSIRSRLRTLVRKNEKPRSTRCFTKTIPRTENLENKDKTMYPLCSKKMASVASPLIGTPLAHPKSQSVGASDIRLEVGVSLREEVLKNMRVWRLRYPCVGSSAAT